MTLPTLDASRFQSEQGLRVIIQTPDAHAQKIVDAVLEVATLQYGDYDSVTFKTVAGTQQFRSLGSGHNAATEAVAEVPCVELSFFLPDDAEKAGAVLKAVYWAHPYEEPVVFMQSCLRTLHIRGLDEDNPNRFWNAPPQDWVPKEHQ